MLHLPPLRFHCVRWCWDRNQDSCDFGIGYPIFANKKHMRNLTNPNIHAIAYEKISPVLFIHFMYCMNSMLLYLKPEVDHDPLVGVHDDVWADVPTAALVLHRHAVLWGADQLIQNGRHQDIGRTERRKIKFLHCLHTSTFPKQYLFRHLNGKCRKMFFIIQIPLCP